MHPAYSVILFTTASGAGYGLLALLSLGGAFGFVPVTQPVALLGFGTAFLLITLGLLSSTAHLGRPERAWRALSQWRSSWLSREGVLAVATYPPAGMLALFWVLREQHNRSGMLLLAAVVAALALATVACTGMIYASLRTIRQWHQPLVAPIYGAFSLATGAVLLTAILSLFGDRTRLPAFFAVAALAATAGLKWRYWQAIDMQKPAHAIGDATGLGKFGAVRALEPAHTQPNFVMREMGYSVARTHAEKLRRLVLAFAFAVPVVLLLAVLSTNGVLRELAALLAVWSTAFGVVVERWLFFAEAEHVVMLYYGRQTA